MLNTLRERYLELKKTGINQRTPLSRMAYNTRRLAPNFVKMLKDNQGFVGPWCTDGACAAYSPPGDELNVSLPDTAFIFPYGQGGEYEGFPEFKMWGEKGGPGN